LIKQIKLDVVAIAGAGIAHFWVTAIRSWINDHLSDLVADSVSIDLFVRNVADRVIVVSDS